MTTINERMADAVMREDDQQKASRGASRGSDDERSAFYPAHVRWTQVAKRHDMALSALRRTLDDTHDQVCDPAPVRSMAWRPRPSSTLSLSTQDGDVPSERRAIRALEEAEALCRSACAGRRAPTMEKEAR